MFISDIRSSTSDILYKCNQLVKNYSKFDSIKDVPHCRHIAQVWLRLFFSWLDTPSGPRPCRFGGFEITLI